VSGLGNGLVHVHVHSGLAAGVCHQ